MTTSNSVVGMVNNSVVQPLLTDLYQVTMAYAYWVSGRTEDSAVFDLFFRRNPFNGEFTIFAGLQDCITFISNFAFSPNDLSYLRSCMPPSTDERFFEYLSTIDASRVKLFALDEGSIAFPRVPVMRVEGPIIVTQLLETTLLNLVNFASLMTTNAARFRLASLGATNRHIELLEFGLRRAQGPDGGLSASRYAYIGGFDATSNLLAGKLYNIPVKGTHAHSFVSSFRGAEDVQHLPLRPKSQNSNERASVKFYEMCLEWQLKMAKIMHLMPQEANQGELAAFTAYACAFPDNFLALVDTYDVLRSGLLNFASVAAALHDLGYIPLGIRIDSGDLAYLSKEARRYFKAIGSHSEKLQWFEKLTIVASNDINEETILALNDQGHEINCFGVGTHLVTCQRQPALGCVYKLVEMNGVAKMKLSQEVQKVTMPGKKQAFRLFSSENHMLLDVMMRENEQKPMVNQRMLCRHPFQESKRAWVTPSRVEDLYKVWWSEGKLMQVLPSMSEIRENVRRGLDSLRPDHKRSLNPTPYKISVSDDLYQFIHRLWLENQPIGELS